jgi:hypothetical protein
VHEVGFAVVLFLDAALGYFPSIFEETWLVDAKTTAGRISGAIANLADYFLERSVPLAKAGPGALHVSGDHVTLFRRCSIRARSKALASLMKFVALRFALSSHLLHQPWVLSGPGTAAATRWREESKKNGKMWSEGGKGYVERWSIGAAIFSFGP